MRFDARGARASTASHRALGALVAFEIAMGVMLVTSAAMLLLSLQQLRSVETGYAADNVLTVEVSPPGGRFDGPAALATYWDDVLERVRSVPGVLSAGGIHIRPFSGDNWNPGLRVRGRDTPVEQLPQVHWRLATPDYFVTMGVPLLEGRDFDQRDAFGAPGVAIISRTLADRVFPDVDPIGLEVRTGFEGPDNWVRIIAIVGDTKDVSLDQQIVPMMYRPMAQWPIPTLELMVRTGAEATTLAEPVRRAIWAVDPDVPITRTQRFDEVVNESIRAERLVTGLLTAFGIVALLLGAVGVFGVQAWAIRQRRAEFGLRLALGAGRSSILASAVTQAAATGTAGVLIGTLGAIATTPLIAHQLYGTTPRDPRAMILAVAVLLAVALGASLGPALAATRVDPVETLRSE